MSTWAALDRTVVTGPACGELLWRMAWAEGLLCPAGGFEVAAGHRQGYYKAGPILYAKRIVHVVTLTRTARANLAR
eukprot:3190092-Amphidinium_carterae.1